MFYIFRSTTAQITGHLEHIEESGDTVISCAFVGEKHWILVCRKGSQSVTVERNVDGWVSTRPPEDYPESTLVAR